MSDYDPDRPSGSGAEPIDPSGGAPYEGSARYPPSVYPSGHDPNQVAGELGYPGAGRAAPGYAGAGQAASGYPNYQTGAPTYPDPAGNPVSASPTGYSPPDPAGRSASQYPVGPNQYPGPFYPDSSYPASSYPASSYPGPSYPASSYPSPSYPGPSYSAYPPYPGGWSSPPRPGQVTGAAVLAYIEAGWLLISALFVFAGASAINGFTENSSVDDGGLTAQFVLAGLANLVAGGLFIAGAALFTGANPSGRQLLVVATAVTVAAALYWIVRFHDGSLVVWAVAYLTMPAIALSLSFGASVTAWLQAVAAQRPSTG